MSVCVCVSALISISSPCCCCRCFLVLFFRLFWNSFPLRFHVYMYMDMVSGSWCSRYHTALEEAPKKLSLPLPLPPPSPTSPVIIIQCESGCEWVKARERKKISIVWIFGMATIVCVCILAFFLLCPHLHSVYLALTLSFAMYVCLLFSQALSIFKSKHPMGGCIHWIKWHVRN